MPKRKTKYFKYFHKEYLELLLLVILFVFLVFILLLCRQAYFTNSGKTNSFLSLKMPEVKTEEKPDYSNMYGIFFDSFSGSGFIDAEKTNLYLNKEAAAVFFPPDYVWQENITEAEASAASLDEKNVLNNNFTGPYNDERCLGKNCLLQKDLKLYYNKKLLSFPTKIKKNNIKAISIAALEKRWLVGFTLQEGDKYRGEAFFYDGKKFTSLVPPQQIISDYFGLFGFGGEENDFLVIYGAYEGIAYRFRGSAVDDISRFFNIRTMKEGFKAEVIKTVNGDNINWYIYSGTLGRPQFLKLWQNGTEFIVGEVVFNLFNNGEQGANFKLSEVNPTEISLIAQVKSGQGTSSYTFIDRGFKNDFEGVLSFLPHYQSGDKPSFTLKKIRMSKMDLSPESRDKVKLLFSADGNKWVDVPQGEDFDFNTEPEFFNSFLLRLVFSPMSDKFSSPFLEKVLFEYYGSRIGEAYIH